MGCSASSTVDPAARKPKAPKTPKPPKATEEPAPKRPRLEPRQVTENDLMWPGKKKLIPDLNVFKDIDQRAINAPNNLRTKPAELVAYLIEPCKTELERFRAIFRWIASHIDYDVDYYNNPGSSGLHDVAACLAAGKAICAGYSGVVLELCSHADIHAEEVSGCSKGGDYKVGDRDEFLIQDGLPTHTDHAWVIVGINGQMFLCDATWAAGKTGSTGGKKVYNSDWDESYFLSDPEAFFETHWPMGDGLYVKQLMKSPNKNFKDWLERPHKKIRTSELGVTLTSHKDGLIETAENEVDIEFTSKYELQTYTNFETKRGNAWVKMEKMTLVYREGSKYKVRVRIPYGNVPFVLQILGKLVDGEGELAKRPLFIVSYKIVCKGDGNSKGYHAKFCERAGIEPDAAKLGFKLESHKSPMISSKGKEAVTISTPNSDPIALTCSFYRLSDGAKLDEQVYLERTKNRIICHVRMYETGEYGLIVHGDLKQENSSSLAMLGNFLIYCSSPLPNEMAPYCRSYNIHGPNKDFLALGLKDLSGDSSIKKAEKGGRCTVRFKVPLNQTYRLFIYDHKGSQLPNPHACAVLDGDILTIHLKLPKPKNFTLGLYRKLNNKSLDDLAFYMIENDEAFEGKLFPELYEVIGPLPQAAEAGLGPLDPKMKYYQKLSKPQCVLKFVANSKLDTFALFQKDGKDKFVDQVVKEENGKYVMTYDVTLPGAGYYSFMIWENGSPTRQLVGMLLECT